VTVFVHLIEGDNAEARLALIARLATASRPAMAVFDETAEPPTAPLDWLFGPGCTCCLLRSHPRLRLLAAAQGQAACRRIIVDAGPQVLAERIAQTLKALPLPFRLIWTTAF
jgi:hypothetical protein